MVMVFLWLFSFDILLLTAFIIYGITLFLFRKKKGIFKENPTLAEGVLHSPVHGKVIKINQDKTHPQFGENLIEVLIRIPWHAGYGIYLPYTSEVKDLLAVKGRDFFRFAKLEGTNIVDRAGIRITLSDQKGDEIGLQLIKCKAGLWPEIKVMPGDRGKRQANIGLLPFGGTLALYIPSKYEILVQEGQEVVAGESLIAGQH